MVCESCSIATGFENLLKSQGGLAKLLLNFFLLTIPFQQINCFIKYHEKISTKNKFFGQLFFIKFNEYENNVNKCPNPHLGITVVDICHGFHCSSTQIFIIWRKI